ncbi:phosphatase PAP2 family protein [Ottowia testudinis]|uniref:Phosphatase PAP2 family protein n=1 Tax=Ottowia testudinis TaxID=2816950 RepID=A0A975CIL3_9BURK|nr:phosphatase PAP2 family protein [Ottowia testudinis]QTD45637.1 phosphatase PAP2 family protein [Ottowia testudinis]
MLSCLAAPANNDERTASHRATARSTTAVWLGVSALGLLALGLWDASGLDLPLAHWFGDASGFALRRDWLLTTVLHDGARKASWGLAVLLALMVWRPSGAWRRMARRERIGLLLGALAPVLVTSLVKRASLTSCPWDLKAFGGSADYVSHWLWGVADGGGGHCFPAGHASAGFAYVAGWFWLRRASPRTAAWWLTAALALGLILGAVQQVRGAHYMSHTLWTAWLCWAAGGAVWWLMAGRRSTPGEPTPVP